METKKQVRDKAFRFLRSFDTENKIREKFNNICGKTGQYNIPSELFLQRTIWNLQSIITNEATLKPALL